MYGVTQNTEATRSQCSLDISTFGVSYKAMTKLAPRVIPVRGWTWKVIEENRKPMTEFFRLLWADLSPIAYIRETKVQTRQSHTIM